MKEELLTASTNTSMPSVRALVCTEESDEIACEGELESDTRYNRMQRLSVPRPLWAFEDGIGK